MARDPSQAAAAAEKTASGTAGNYGGAASSINSTLTPELTQEALHPTGFTPQQQNSMLTASAQGAGGATGGITGQTALQAARTRNSGATSAILDQAARTKQQAISQNALGIQNQSAKLAQQKQQEGLQGLSGLYGTDVHAQLGAMGQEAPDINSEVNAQKEGWLQNTEGVIDTLANAGKAGAAFA
jgi:hypothetical protein